MHHLDLGLFKYQVTYTRKMLRSEEHTSELQSRSDLVCRLLLETKHHTSERHSRSDVLRRLRFGTHGSTSPPSSGCTPPCCRTAAARAAGTTAARCSWEPGTRTASGRRSPDPVAARARCDARTGSRAPRATTPATVPQSPAATPKCRPA